MRAVLAGTEDEINFLFGRIIAAEGLGRFRSEPDSVCGKVETVRATEGAEIDRSERFLCDEIHHGQGMQRSGTASAIVGDVSGFAVRGGDDFVRIVADGNSGEDF